MAEWRVEIGAVAVGVTLFVALGLVSGEIDRTALVASAVTAVVMLTALGLMRALRLRAHGNTRLADPTNSLEEPYDGHIGP